MKKFLLPLFALLIMNAGAQKVADSLQGFDEELAHQAAIAENYFGQEFDVYMANARRSYIDAKYNLRSGTLYAKGGNPVTLSAACMNDDFENVPGAGAPGVLTLTTTTSVPGWSVDRGNNTNSCITPTFPNPPNEVSIIGHSLATGYIDPIVGPSYPIFSVFGPTTAVNGGTAVAGNSTITPGMYGNYFIRLNDQNPGTNEERVSACFSVTPQNALFQFAFMFVADATGHPCCGQPSMHINLYNGCGGPLITCPNYSFTIPGASCTNTVPVTFFPGTGSTSYFSWNKWKISAIDLSAYIGSQIQIEVAASDCNGGAHAGYMYFDAQCGPMDVLVNGTPSPMSSPIGMCGSGSPTITAPLGFAPYQWAGPAGFTATTQVINPTTSGIYTLNMGGMGTCLPATYILTVTATGTVPVTAASSNSLICLGNSATLTASGAATYTWSTGATGSSIVITPTASAMYTVTGTDSSGCSGTTSLIQTVSACTGINGLTAYNVLKLYPNPNNGEFTLNVGLHLDKGELLIENALGQIVHSQAITEGDNRIRTKNLAPGIYYYTVTENRIAIGKGKLKIE